MTTAPNKTTKKEKVKKLIIKPFILQILYGEIDITIKKDENGTR